MSVRPINIELFVIIASNFCDIYICQVNGVKLADIMFSLVCVCARAHCALSRIGKVG